MVDSGQAMIVRVGGIGVQLTKLIFGFFVVFLMSFSVFAQEEGPSPLIQDFSDTVDAPPEESFTPPPEPSEAPDLSEANRVDESVYREFVNATPEGVIEPANTQELLDEPIEASKTFSVVRFLVLILVIVFIFVYIYRIRKKHSKE